MINRHLTRLKLYRRKARSGVTCPWQLAESYQTDAGKTRVGMDRKELFQGLR